MMVKLSIIRRVAMTAISLAVAYALCLYPAGMSLRVVLDGYRSEAGVPSYISSWHRRVSHRFLEWAETYLNERRAAAVDHNDVAATEWPMFGSVFYLLSVEALIDQKALRFGEDSATDRAVDAAARIVADPTTATWVRDMWGDEYLKTENVFYRMLLIMGLTAHQKITGQKTHEALVREQATSLGSALAAAPHHLLDDYPGECYPSDDLWAVAAIRRADALLNADHRELAADLMVSLDQGEARDLGIPVYEADADTGKPESPARGCSNSGILLFAPELDLPTARRWYAAHEAHFWQTGTFLSGFREFSKGGPDAYMDVDSGPVLFGIGSVASAFGIGAARTMGRFDHFAPLAAEVVVLSWPTPVGHILPAFMGMAAGAAPLGEVAILFSLTRPVQDAITPFKGPVPLVVWISIVCYATVGGLILANEVSRWRRWISKADRKPDAPILWGAWAFGLGLCAFGLLARLYAFAILGAWLTILASEIAYRSGKTRRPRR